MIDIHPSAEGSDSVLGSITLGVHLPPTLVMTDVENVRSHPPTSILIPDQPQVQ